MGVYTEGSPKTPKRLIINVIIKRFALKIRNHKTYFTIAMLNAPD
jgi:hypothetical protein